MFCILNIAQSYEAFLSRYMRIKFVDIPFNKKRLINIDDANSIIKLLADITKILAFDDLRNIFLRLVIENHEYLTLEEIKDEFDAIRINVSINTVNRIKHSFSKYRSDMEIEIKNTKLEDHSKKWNCPTDKEIKNIEDAVFSRYLLGIKKTTINQARNKVVHNAAFRPTFEDSNQYLSEARNLIFNLDNILKIDYMSVPSMSPQ